MHLRSSQDYLRQIQYMHRIFTTCCKLKPQPLHPPPRELLTGYFEPQTRTQVISSRRWCVETGELERRFYQLLGGETRPRGAVGAPPLSRCLRFRLWSSGGRVSKQPAPAPHLAHPEGCAALRIVLVTVPRVARSCEHFPDGFELHLLPRQAHPERRLGACGSPALKVQGYFAPKKQPPPRTLQ